MNELEDIFHAIHAGVSEDYAVALPAITYNLCVSLGYEDPFSDEPYERIQP